MNLPTMEKDKEDYYQQFFEDEISQPLVKKSPTDVIIESKKSGFINKFGKRIISNLLIWGGGWMLFSILWRLILMPDNLQIGDSLFMLLSYLIIGSALLFFGVGKIKKKSDWLLFAIFPLMGCVFGFLLRLEPINWWRDGNFFSGLFVLFFVALFIFYYIKDYFQTSDN